MTTSNKTTTPIMIGVFDIFYIYYLEIISPCTPK